MNHSIHQWTRWCRPRGIPGCNEGAWLPPLHPRAVPLRQSVARLAPLNSLVLSCFVVPRRSSAVWLTLSIVASKNLEYTFLDYRSMHRFNFKSVHCYCMTFILTFYCNNWRVIEWLTTFIIYPIKKLLTFLAQNFSKFTNSFIIWITPFFT